MAPRIAERQMGQAGAAYSSSGTRRDGRTEWAQRSAWCSYTRRTYERTVRRGAYLLRGRGSKCISCVTGGWLLATALSARWRRSSSARATKSASFSMWCSLFHRRTPRAMRRREIVAYKANSTNIAERIQRRLKYFTRQINLNLRMATNHWSVQSCRV